VLEQLGRFVADLGWDGLPLPVKEGARRVLQDSIAVMVAGGRLEDQAMLRSALPVGSEGTVTVLGSEACYGVTDAAWLNGNALVALELDEGNKRIRGHATAHVLPAVLALAEHRHAPGSELGAAFVAGHEVASRFGESTMLRPGVHPHGNWGVAGAAAGAARIQNADAGTAARAMDAAGALALTTPFEVATAGLSVRNAWIGGANVAGIYAATLARIDQPVVGVAEHSLGQLLGTLDLATLVEGLGAAFAMRGGYFKRHASCSYTHPPADAALELYRERGPLDADDVTRIDVETHRLAAQLDGTTWVTRLAAMFSIPYVVAVTLRDGICGPVQFDERHRGDPVLAALARRVRVTEDSSLTSQLPEHRGARVSVTWSDGSKWQREVPNPVGDIDHLPLSDEDLLAKATLLLGGVGPAEEVQALAAELLETDDVSRPLAALRRLACQRRQPTAELDQEVCP